MTELCNCCPIGLNRCYLQEEDITCLDAVALELFPTTSPIPTTTLTANPDNRPIANPPLSRTADENTAGGSYSGFSTPGGNMTGAINIIIDYTYPTVQDRVLNVRLWNQGGGDTSDFDGLGDGTIVELFDAADVLLFTGPLFSANGGAIQVTNIAAYPGLDGVARLRLRNIMKRSNSTAAPLWRNINLQLAYQALLTWNCAPFTVTALAEGALAGLVPGVGTLTQTNGPHTLTFDSPLAFTGTIVTNNPGNFSTLAITNGSVVTVTGNQANQFVINYEFEETQFIPQPAYGLLCDGVVVWYTSEGVEIDPSILVDC